MLVDKSCILNALEIEEAYKSYEWAFLTRRHLIQRLPGHFETNLFILSAPGIANILALRITTRKLMKVVASDIDDVIEKSLEREPKTITTKCLTKKRSINI